MLTLSNLGDLLRSGISDHAYFYFEMEFSFQCVFVCVYLTQCSLRMLSVNILLINDHDKVKLSTHKNELH